MSEFLSWLDRWFTDLSSRKLEDLKINPTKVALISVDMINGFCHKGPLASREVASIIPNVVAAFNRCHLHGVRNFLLLQDSHSPDATEFEAYPPHCMKGTVESKTIPEISKLPFSRLFTIIEKNSISPAFSKSFINWMKDHREVNNFIIVGNCTDLCVYTVAMHLRLSANAEDLKRRIIVVSNCVATYNLEVGSSKKIGALAHDGELLHKLFLYHMRLNGVEVVGSLKY